MIAKPLMLWVDDLRPPPDDRWTWVTTSKEAIEIMSEQMPSFLDLDHDLGGDDTTRPIMLWMCENDKWPVVIGVHSMNPVGCTWLWGMIDRYGPK